MKKIIINNIFKTHEAGKVKLNYEIKTDTKTDVLWFAVDKKYEKYMCDDRIDSVVVGVVLVAMKYKYELIESKYPISKKLYYNLTYHVLPQIYACENKKYPLIKIEAPLTEEKYNPTEVAAGMSRGVDSFATLYEYGENCQFPDYKITTFSYHNAGAHHGNDVIVGRSKYKTSDLYDKELEDTKMFCKKYHYPLIEVDSNLSFFLTVNIGKTLFDRTHTMRNASLALLMQKLYKRYYYSSAVNLDLFKVSLDDTSTKYEKWLLPYLNTENIEFYNTNQHWNRLEKLEKISSLKESYDSLSVCLVSPKNCGKCIKCKETLMMLDILGELDKYKKSFNIEEYYKNDKEVWFSEIIKEINRKGPFGHDFEDIFNYIVDVKHEKINIKPDEISKKDQLLILNKASDIKKYPFLNSEKIATVLKNKNFITNTRYGNYYKIMLNDGRDGYISIKDVNILDSKSEKSKIFIKRNSNLRANPNINSTIVETIPNKKQFKVIYRMGNWLALELNENKIVFTSVKNVALSKLERIKRKVLNQKN